MVYVPGKAPCTQVWALGMTMESVTPPVFILEASLLFPLFIVEKTLQEDEIRPECIKIRAGNWRTDPGLQKWFDMGELEFTPEVAPDMVSACRRLAKLLPCRLQVSRSGWDFFENVGPHNEQTAENIASAAKKSYRHAVVLAKRKW